jgi:protocatechuate 3,4-dioxygenase beta subunit
MKKLLSILSIAFFLTGCGSGVSTSAVSGSISAPGGSFAFNPPGKIEQFFASLIGSPAVAKIDGLAGVGSGVTVNLIEIDADGNQVGDVIATATTNSAGTYSLSVPTGYSAAAKYAIVGTGTSDTIKSMWEGATVDVDPGSNATMSALLDAATDLSTLDTKEIISARELIEDFTENLDTDESSNVTNYTANLKAALQNDSEAAKMLSNKTAAGEVCGTVTNASDNPVDNIRIFARDFSDFSKMAKTKTAADGSYCFNAPVGQELMVGAINRTTASDAASEFYTAASPADASGTKCHLIHCADKLTVTSSTTADFKLVQGGLITGTITGSGNTLKKVKVLFRNALTKKPAGATKTNKDGVYTMNLAPGDYIVYFKNSTKKAFGSTAYTTNTTYYDSGQAVDRNFAEKLTLTAGSELTANAALLTGGTLTGTITDNSGDPVEFAKLRIDQIKDNNSHCSDDSYADQSACEAASETWATGYTVDLQADRFHTNKHGVYRVQLPFGTYTISARGEFKDGVSNAGYTLDSSNLIHTVDFDHQTNAITVKLTDSGTCSVGTYTDQSACEVNSETWTVAGIGSITAKVRDINTGKSTGNPTMSDGTTTLYVPDGNYTFSIIVNNGTNTASCNWNGTTCSPDSGKDLNSDAINITGDDSATFANITMPTGFPISGTVKDVNGDPLPGAKIIPQIEISSGVWKTFVAGKTGADGMYTVTIPGNTAYRLFAKLSNSIKGKYLGSNNGNGCTISEATTVDFDGTGKTEDFVVKYDHDNDPNTAKVNACPSDLLE